MSPEDRVARLQSEVAAELERIARVAADLRSAPPLGPESTTVARTAVAAWLHAFYTGCEAVLARIGNLFPAPPRSEGWHRDLLVRSAAPIAGERPPIVSPDTALALHELLGFRHFFRTSYGVDLIPERLAALTAIALEAHEGFRADIARFLEAMRRAG